MSESIRTSDDPQPEDLDQLLETLDPELIEDNPGGQRVRSRFMVDVDAADLERLRRIAAARGEDPQAVISSLLREADRPAA
jgi:hypothetical protein